MRYDHGVDQRFLHVLFGPLDVAKATAQRAPLRARRCKVHVCQSLEGKKVPCPHHCDPTFLPITLTLPEHHFRFGSQ